MEKKDLWKIAGIITVGITVIGYGVFQLFKTNPAKENPAATKEDPAATQQNQPAA